MPVEKPLPVVKRSARLPTFTRAASSATETAAPSSAYGSHLAALASVRSPGSAEVKRTSS
ncbi:MAG: hypothetical protein DYH06_14125 [Acidobacteria bacterium ACB2]|nr:hypothetical protein [Acidobacteria bacterium ACB2]